MSLVLMLTTDFTIRLRDIQKCNAIARGAKTPYSHNQTCRDRILVGVREDDSERAQNYDEEHIRRAMHRQDAQTQSQAPPEQQTEPTPHDGQPHDDRVSHTRPRESDLPVQGGVTSIISSERPDITEPSTKKQMTPTQRSKRWGRTGHMQCTPTLGRHKHPADTPAEQHEHDTTQSQLSEPPSQPFPGLLPLPLDVPRSGRTDIENIVMPCQSASSSSVPVPVQPVHGSEVQRWLSQIKAELLPCFEAKIMNAVNLNQGDISADEVRDMAIMSVELGAVDSLEVFSPTRFTDPAVCSKLGLRPGFAIDLSECKPYGPNMGEPWDLNKPNDTKELKEMVDSEEPFLLTASPP